MELPLPEPTTPDIFSFGFDKNLNRPFDSERNPFIYNSIEDQIIPTLISGGAITMGSGGQVVMKNISVGSSAIQYAIGDAGSINFGDGSDGEVVISADTTLTADRYYENLTINPGIVLTPAGYRIFCRNQLNNYGTIRRNGGAGGNGSAGSGTSGGSGGSAGTAVGAGYFLAGVAGAGGGGGGNAGGNGVGGNNGSDSPNGLGNDGVAGGAGGVGGGGGTAGAGGVGAVFTAATVALRANWHLQTLLDINAAGATVKYSGSSSSGGGGGGSGGAGAGGGGGGGGGGSGSEGGMIAIYAREFINHASGIIQSNGGAGGNGGNGAAGGGDGGGGGGGTGAGGNGGVIILVYNKYTNLGTVQANGGAAGATVGTGGTGTPAGANGSLGTAGVATTVREFQISL